MADYGVRVRLKRHFLDLDGKNLYLNTHAGRHDLQTYLREHLAENIDITENSRRAEIDVVFRTINERDRFIWKCRTQADEIHEYTE